ncbi:MAG: hydrolase [Pseudomonadota bacterium]
MAIYPEIGNLLTPNNCVVAFIDHQPQMSFGVRSHDIQTIKNNTVALAKVCKVFNVPTVLTTVETESFSGYTWPELIEALDGQQTVERTSMNSYEDKGFVRAVKATGRKKLVLTGLWTEVCIAFPAACALEDGFEVFFVSDCCGATSKEAHDMAVQQMIQKGAQPRTWQQTMLEFQRDWARRETYEPVMNIVREHSGEYGIGVDYAYTRVHGSPQRGKFQQEVPVAS